jgi:hypothetical protein
MFYGRVELIAAERLLAVARNYCAPGSAVMLFLRTNSTEFVAPWCAPGLLQGSGDDFYKTMFCITLKYEQSGFPRR